MKQVVELLLGVILSAVVFVLICKALGVNYQDFIDLITIHLHQKNVKM